MPFTPPNGPKLLPDGREVIGTLTAANMLGVHGQYFPTLARKEGLTRFATKNSRGVAAHYWLREEVEALRAARFGGNLVLDVEPGEFVEAPFEAKDN